MVSNYKWRLRAREAALKVINEFPAGRSYPKLEPIVRGNPTEEEIKAAVEEIKALLGAYEVPKGFQYCLW